MACNNLEQQITSVAIAHTYWMTFKQSVKADRQREGGWEGQSDMCGVTTLFHLPGIKICSFSKDIPLKSHDLSQYTVNRQSISAFQWHACGDVFRRSTKKNDHRFSQISLKVLSAEHMTFPKYKNIYKPLVIVSSTFYRSLRHFSGCTLILYWPTLGPYQWIVIQNIG